MTKTNKKGKELMDDVNAEWASFKDSRDSRKEILGMDDFKKGAQSFIGQIKGQSTGEGGWVAKNDFQIKKMKGFLMKRGIFDAVGGTTASAEQIAQRKKREAKALKLELKRKEKRQRGSRTLAKRKMEVPAYLQKLEELKKYKKGFQILLDYYGLSRCAPSTRLKLEKLGLVK